MTTQCVSVRSARWLQVGSIDCLDKGFQVESFNEYMTLVMKAKSLSENFVNSGLDDK